MLFALVGLLRSIVQLWIVEHYLRLGHLERAIKPCRKSSQERIILETAAS